MDRAVSTLKTGPQYIIGYERVENVYFCGITKPPSFVYYRQNTLWEAPDKGSAILGRCINNTSFRRYKRQHSGDLVELFGPQHVSSTG